LTENGDKTSGRHAQSEARKEKRRLDPGHFVEKEAARWRTQDLQTTELGVAKLTYTHLADDSAP
jgi:hypothetical protein